MESDQELEQRRDEEQRQDEELEQQARDREATASEQGATADPEAAKDGDPKPGERGQPNQTPTGSTISGRGKTDAVSPEAATKLEEFGMGGPENLGPTETKREPGRGKVTAKEHKERAIPVRVVEDDDDDQDAQAQAAQQRQDRAEGQPVRY